MMNTASISTSDDVSSCFAATPYGAVFVTLKPMGVLESVLRPLDAGPHRRLVVIDGKRCRFGSEFFGEWMHAMQFPDYFGHNWDAFEEVMEDRDFEPYENTCVLVIAADRMLERKQGQREICARILERVPNRVEVAPYGRTPRRVPMPALWIVLQCDRSEAADEWITLISNSIRMT